MNEHSASLIPVDKIGKCIRLLASDKPGEIVAAAHALQRTLAGAGVDLHWLAARVEANATHVSHFNRTSSQTGYEVHAWREHLKLCAARIDALAEREQDFIASLVSSTQWRDPTAKQQLWLADIAARLRRAAA
jgi:hypothetical protein